MVVLKRMNPKIPNVLVAVAVTVVISWLIGFEQTEKTNPNQILHKPTRELIQSQHNLMDDLSAISAKVKETKESVKKLTAEKGQYDEATIAASTELNALQLEYERRQEQGKADKKILKDLRLRRVDRGGGRSPIFYVEGHIPDHLEIAAQILAN